MQKVTLDPDLQILVEEVLALAQRTVDAQYDEDVQDELQSIVDTVGELFGCDRTELTVTAIDEDTFTVTIEQPKPIKPTLTLVSNRDDEDA